MKSTTRQPELELNRWWWFESLVLLLLCYLKAGWPPPDENEAHYLAKARSYWDPSWCPGDFFLNSADAHEVFYWTFGWVCVFTSLPAAAWIGRLITWGLLAWSWQRLSFALCPVRFAAILSGGLMLVLTAVGHMAGEWIVGGVEAKGFAFVLVFLGLEAVVRGRWMWVWPLLGGAASFHVLVGGWAVVAAMFAWLTSGGERPAIVRMLPSLAGGFVLALLGLVPVLMLNWNVDAETIGEANVIYVYERLPHHLVFHQFPWLWMARHAALTLFFALLAYAVGWIWRSQSVQDLRIRRLAAFIAGAVVLTIIGIIIDQATLDRFYLASSLLRFYWYRLADVMVPSGVALLLPVVLVRLKSRQPRLAMLGLIACLVAALVPLLSWNVQRRQHLLPGAVVQARRKAGESPEQVAARFSDWRAVCDWIEAKTPDDAVFLTPRRQQTFKWFAGRAEVVSGKDIPQDARGIVEWWQRLREVYPPQVSEFGFAALREQQVIDLARKYGASYVVVETSRPARMMNLPRVYPTDSEWNESFAVYRIPDDAED